MQKAKRLIIAKSGLQFITLKVEEVAYFTTSNKIVFAVTAGGKKYLTNYNLAQLEAELDPELFFRINRQHIINVVYVRSFVPYKKGQLLLTLHIPSDTEIIVSQALTPLFKEWIHNL